MVSRLRGKFRMASGMTTNTTARIAAPPISKRRRTSPSIGIAAPRQMGEFRAEKDNLRRVINPDDEHYHRARRPVGRAGRGLRQIDSDQVLANGEQQRGYATANPSLPPVNSRGRHILEHE